ncbi:hypothetical protein MMC11_006145 [Xylographa trunciseda]|nr:hypothetical protein [Xylographa trunciseda]
MQGGKGVYTPLSRSDGFNTQCGIDAASKDERGCIVAILLLGLSVSFFIAAVFRGVSDGECIARLSTYSPAIESVEYEELNFDNLFRHQTVYRGPPTNELEREWERLYFHDLVAIPEDKFRHLNKSADRKYIQIPSRLGGGYAANIDVFHQLHCLNLIRQYTWREYYEAYPDRVETPSDIVLDTKEGLRTHVDHCIETLRLNLMCHGDVTPYIFVKESDDDILGTADFNAHHKCRRFDKLVDFFEKKAVVSRWPGWPAGHRQFTKDEYKGLPNEYGST